MHQVHNFIILDLYNCNRLPLSQILTGTKSENTTYKYLSLNCSGNNITSISNFGISSNQQAESSNLLACANYTSSASTLQIKSSCDFTNYANQILLKNCNGGDYCEIPVDLGYLNTNCNVTEFYRFFYLSYQCHNNIIQTGTFNATIPRSIIGFLIVSIDIGSMMALLICIFMISKGQEDTEEEFNKENLFISDYTLYLNGVNFAYKNSYQEIGGLINHLKTVLNTEMWNLKDKKYLRNLLALNTEHENNFVYKDAEKKILKKVVEQCFVYDVNYAIINSDKLDNIINYNNLEFEKLKLSKEDNLQNDEKEVKFKILESKLKKIQEDIKKEDQVKDIDQLFITFRNQQIAKFFRITYDKNKFARCCLIFCCKYDKIKHL